MENSIRALKIGPSITFLSTMFTLGISTYLLVISIINIPLYSFPYILSSSLRISSSTEFFIPILALFFAAPLIDTPFHISQLATDLLEPPQL